MGEVENVFSELALRFPAQSSPDRMRLYIKDLGRFGFELEDLREGCQRVIHVREQATFPPFAQVLRCCNEARADRLKGRGAARRVERDYVPRPVVYDATPVRGVRDTSPAYRDPGWWAAHPAQPAGKSLRIQRCKWLRWHLDTRPWADAERIHTKYSTDEPRKPQGKMEPLSGVILNELDRLQAERAAEVPF